MTRSCSRQQLIADGPIRNGDAVYATPWGGVWAQVPASPSAVSFGIAMGNAGPGDQVTVLVNEEHDATGINRCTATIGDGAPELGKKMRCDLRVGHAGNHQHNDFAFRFREAGQAGRDQQIAIESVATLDRELGLLDGLLEDVKPKLETVSFAGVDLGYAWEARLDARMPTHVVGASSLVPARGWPAQRFSTPLEDLAADAPAPSQPGLTRPLKP